VSELERDLRALGGAIAYPATPDLGATVSRALTSRRRWPWRTWATVAVALVALAIGVTLAVPPARTAVFRFFHIGAVHVRFVDRLPQVEEQKVVPPGERVSANQSPFPLLRSPLLGPPDAVYTDGATLTQVFGKPGAARLFIMQIPYAGLSPEIVKKVATVSGTRTSFVTVAGASEPGLWIEGERHIVRFPGWPARLAGNTLVWVRDAATVRVEGSLSREQAVRIASSLR
jgi:hypothetical protein